MRALVPERDVRIAYSPLHGVGGQVMLDAFAQAGFAAPAVVIAATLSKGEPVEGRQDRPSTSSG